MKNLKPKSTTYQGFRVVVIFGLLQGLLFNLELSWWKFNAFSFWSYLVASIVYMAYTGKEAFVKYAFARYKGEAE